jgi:hypothetical protein
MKEVCGLILSEVRGVVPGGEWQELRAVQSRTCLEMAPCEQENYYLRRSNGCKWHANACDFEREGMGKEPVSCEVYMDVAAGARYIV